MDIEIQSQEQEENRFLEKKSTSNSIIIDLRKRKEKTIIEISEEEMINKSEKLLVMLKRECVDLKTWFYIIVSQK
jgi:hypothetical protein